MRLGKAIIHEQRGQALIFLVLIIFTITCLLIAPLLKYMATGIVTAKNKGIFVQEIYAAEAGVNDAIWKIQHIAPGLPTSPTDPPLQFTITDNPNAKSVEVTVYYVESIPYRIHSVATNPDTGHQSKIDSDLNIIDIGVDLTAFTKYALTSPGTITAKSSDDINGDIWVQSSDNYSGPPPSGDIVVAPVTGWPTAQELKTYFDNQVDTSTFYSESTIDVSQPGMSGPLYAHGYPNGNYVLTGTGALTGPLYIDGNLYADNNANIDLNGQTIFVLGSFNTSPQSAFQGPGAVIAVGDIVFQPSVSGDFIFVLSVSGQINFQPQGDFVGSVAGDTSITLQPNCTLTWMDPGVGNLNLPGLYIQVSGIKNWDIR